MACLLRARGVEAQPRGGGRTGPHDGRPFLCFADRDPEDLVCHGCKILGSAQRRRSGAILQHGSLLLERSSRTPEFSGASDLTAVESDPGFWSRIVISELPPALGLVPVSEGVPAELRRRCAELEQAVYENHAWNRRR
jgi:lipoate-protein ligase A